MSSSAALSRRPAMSRAILCCALVTALGGCSSLGAVRREAPVRTPEIAVDKPLVPTPTPPTWVVQRRPEAVTVRAVDVPVPAGFEPPVVRFADTTFGAALFTRCGVDDPAAGTRNACTARLLVTTDGGRSWLPRQHPQPVAAEQELRVGSDGTLLLGASPNAWYVSTDLGENFQRLPYSPEPPAAVRGSLGGEFQLCCSDTPAKVVRYADGKVKAVPAAPPLPGRLAATVYRAGQDLWAASIDRGMAYSAFSADEGQTWQRHALPGSQGGLEELSLLVSADGSNVWLLGIRADDQRFPAVWRFDPAGWRLMPAVGHPEAYRSAVPLGAGLLAATGPLGTGVAGERWTPTDWPSGGTLRLLADGTLLMTDDRDGTVWLGTGPGVDRRWAQLVLRPSEVVSPR